MNRFVAIFLLLIAMLTAGTYSVAAVSTHPVSNAYASSDVTTVTTVSGLSPATAALSDGDDIRARFLAGR